MIVADRGLVCPSSRRAIVWGRTGANKPSAHAERGVGCSFGIQRVGVANHALAEGETNRLENKTSCVRVGSRLALYYNRVRQCL